jgi:hypothetical protein
LPRKPTTPAAATQPRCVSGTGSTNLRIASTAATTAEIAITATTNNPARSSTRPKPYVYRCVAARRLTEKAIHSGTAVKASEKLCTVSANNATELDIATMASCAAAVMPSTTRLILTVRIPAALSRIASSTLPAWS